MPDWAAVADDHDAVHLTWAGALGAEGHVVGVPELGPRTVTMLRYWRAEQTLWLRDCFGDADPLPAPWIEPEERRDDQPLAVDVTVDRERAAIDRRSLRTFLGRDPG